MAWGGGRLLGCLALLCASGALPHSLGEADEAYDKALYRRVVPVNTSECLDKVLSLPLRVYEFAYDTVKGRRQLGVIGDELESILPDSVEVKQHAFKNPDSTSASKIVKIDNFATVDKTVLFMYNVGATQRLLEVQEDLDDQVNRLEEAAGKHLASISQLEERLAAEVEAQLVEKRLLEEAAAVKARVEAELAVVQEEEQRKTLARQAEVEKAVVDHEEQLAGERLVLEDERERNRTATTMRLQEQANRRSEQQRRATELLLKEKQLEQDRVLEGERRAAELERVAAEAKARAEAERANEDISLRQIAAKGAEDRKRTLEAISAVFAHIGRGSLALLSNPSQLATLLLSILAVIAGGFIARESAILARQILEARLGRPRLVRETSRQRWLAISPWQWVQALHRKGNVPASDVARFFSDVVLSGALTERVQQLAVSTRNARRNGVPYRHLLLYGPPGTGKTMVAQRLAKASGMDYALMSGGDVGPLGKDAVTELHALFRWAKRSPNGLLLFIDEAEAFLGSRSRNSLSEELRNALNALLYQTGTQSYSFMMVLATNRAEDLDSAVIDRMDESLYFPLPDEGLRRQLVTNYFNTYVLAVTKAGREKNKKWWSDMAKVLLGEGTAPIVVDIDKLQDQLKCIATRVDGFSGREISKLMVAVQSAAYGSEKNSLTTKRLDNVVTLKVDEHQRKMDMVAGVHQSPRAAKRPPSAARGASSR